MKKKRKIIIMRKKNEKKNNEKKKTFLKFLNNYKVKFFILYKKKSVERLYY
jgi:hypothetical protein